MNPPVRFFAYVLMDGDLEVDEIPETLFRTLADEYGCTYERHTVRENGCNQIVLTAKNSHEHIDERNITE